MRWMYALSDSASMNTTEFSYVAIAMAGPLQGDPLPWPSLRRRRRRRYSLRG